MRLLVVDVDQRAGEGERDPELLRDLARRGLSRGPKGAPPLCAQGIDPDLLIKARPVPSEYSAPWCDL